MTQHERLRPYFFLALLAGAAALAVTILSPFLIPLALAAVFAVVLEKPNRRLAKFFPGYPSVAALLTILISVLVVLAPLSAVATLVGAEARTLYATLETGVGPGALEALLSKADSIVGDTIPGFSQFTANASANLDVYAKDAVRFIAEHAGSIFSSISSLALSFFIFFIALYYLLRDGKRVRRVLIELSPLSDSEDGSIFDRLELAINSVIKGNFTIALIQGALSTAGFALFGVPSPVLWGVVASFAALIPGVGTSLVLVPAIGYLFLTGATAAAFALSAWAILAVGFIDNLLGPKLMGKGMQIHPLLVLLSVLGGLSFFGPAGIFLGPLSLSLFFALLSIYGDLSKGASVRVSDK